MKKPNIIICQCDQMRAHTVGCYGNKEIRTPNIDQLAEKGIVFESAFTNNPVCSPARSSIITGQYCRTCTGSLRNADGNPPNPKRMLIPDTTIAEVCRDNGYNTALIGKWHIEPQPQLLGFEKAFYPKIEHKHYGQTYYDENAQPTVIEEFGPEYEFKIVDEYLASQKEQPFFLYYNISPPHQPIGPEHMPEAFTNLYDPEKIDLRLNVEQYPPDDGIDRNEWQKIRDFWFKTYSDDEYYWNNCAGLINTSNDYPLPENFEIKELTALYYNAISYVDSLLGRLIDSLKENDLFDNTILVFTSDHGDHLGSHGLFNKGTLIEEAIRIPAIYHYPDELKPQRVTERLTQTIDVMPTVLSLAELPIPDSVQGKVSLGKKQMECSEIYIEAIARQIGIRTKNYLFGMHLDENFNVTHDYGLYDLDNDPYEMNNLIHDKSLEGTKKRLKKKLLKWHNSTPWLKPVEKGNVQ